MKNKNKKCSYFFIISNFLIIAAMVWFCVIVGRVLLSKEYRKFPPFVPSFGNEKRILVDEVVKLLKTSKKQLTILDPGCGTGTLLLKLAKEFPNHKFIGIEWSMFFGIICKIRCYRFKNVEIIRDDMFKHDFGQADIVVCFLMEPLMKKFGEKILADNKKEQVIFSNTFKIPNLPLVHEIETGKGILFKNIYIYKL